MTSIKKEVLIICPWVEPEGPIGIFFREQANLVADEFNVTLIRIDSIGIRKTLNNGFAFFSLRLIKTIENLDLLKFSILQSKSLPGFINKFFRERVVTTIGKRFNLNSNRNVLIHVQSILEAGNWGNSLNKRFGNPFIVTEHNLFILKNASEKKIVEINQTLKNAKKILVVSHDKARQILMNDFQFRFEVIGNYVNEAVFSPSSQKNITCFKIITIGAYSFIKDPQTIFDMLKLIDSEDYNMPVEFIYAGFDSWGGNHYVQVNEKLGELDLKKIKVKLIPIATRHEIAELLRTSDLFVLSSISEGMPVSLLEALATGIPACTTQCGGVDELITESNGKIVPIRDYHAMYSFVNNCIRGRLKFDRVHISQHVISEYGTNAFKAKLLNYYNME